MSKEKVNYQLLGEMIKNVRKNAGLNQAELAELIEVSPQFISKIESGLKHASLQTVYSIAKSLNVSVDLIMGIETDKTGEKSPFSLILEDCSVYEAEVIRQLALSAREILKNNAKRYDFDS